MAAKPSLWYSLCLIQLQGESGGLVICVLCRRGKPNREKWLSGKQSSTISNLFCISKRTQNSLMWLLTLL